MAESEDVLLGWMVTAPEGAEPAAEDVLKCAGSQRSDIAVRALAYSKDAGGGAKPLLVDLDGTTWGMVGILRFANGLALWRGLCSLEGLKDGTDYIGDLETGAGEPKLVLVKQETFCAFLCRMWSRERLHDNVRQLLAEGGACPFNPAGEVILRSEDAAAQHYLELLLGRGAKQECPQAEKYLQGVARDMQLSQLPYLSTVLDGRLGLKADQSVLDILTRLDGGGGVPADVKGDLALAVAQKALELVDVMGLDL